MSETTQSAKPLPLRQSEDGTWEVENVAGNWIRCHTEQDARILSNAPVVLEQSYTSVFPDEALAVRLEETAQILEDYKIGFESRFFRSRAKRARGEQSK